MAIGKEDPAQRGVRYPLLITAEDGPGEEHQWHCLVYPQTTLQEVIEHWAARYQVPPKAVVLEDEGVELDANATPKSLHWAKGAQKMLCAVPCDEEHMHPGDLEIPCAATMPKEREKRPAEVEPEPRAKAKAKVVQASKPEPAPKAKPQKPETASKPKPAPEATERAKALPARSGVPTDDEPIRYEQENPKKAGSTAAERYDKYKVARTPREAISLGAAKGDIKYDFERGWLKRA